LEVAQVDALGGDPRTVLAWAGAVEQFSDHPIGQAIMRHVLQQEITCAMPEEFASIPGGGLRGRVGGGGSGPTSAPPVGTEIVVGSVVFLELENIPLDPAVAEPLQRQGMTVVAVAAGGRLRGLIGLRDALRHDAAATIATLRARGITVGVISGDAETAVRGALGDIPVDLLYAAVRPEDKARLVTELVSTSDHHVAFVGDGTNDAPALAAADLGIALATGTDLARAAGDVLLVAPRLSAVPQTLELADATIRIIHQNLFWAFGYNVLAIPLAMFNILPPGVAAGAMVLSSISVVANALRLNRVAH